MTIDLQIIVLGTTKYSDSSLILHTYTKEYGRLSIMLKGVRNAKKGSIRTALFQPLNCLDTVVDYKPKRELQYLKEAKIHTVYNSLHRDIAKSSVVLFLSEVLGQLLREEYAENEPLYTYITQAFTWFDDEEKAPNFHLKFLMELTKLLGVYPNFMEPKTGFFDLDAAAYVQQQPVENFISGELLKHWEALHRSSFDTISELSFNQQIRLGLLSQIIVYYRLHLQNFKEPKSLAVLHGLFQ